MGETCAYCNRPVVQRGERQYTSASLHHPFMTLVVIVHAGYGCDTGCCGHQVIALDADGAEVHSEFVFDHPESNASDDERLAWTKELAASVYGPTIPLKWDGCEVYEI